LDNYRFYKKVQDFFEKLALQVVFWKFIILTDLGLQDCSRTCRIYKLGKDEGRIGKDGKIIIKGLGYYR